MVVMHH